MKTLTPQILGMYLGQKCLWIDEIYKVVSVSVLGGGSQQVRILRDGASVTRSPESLEHIKLLLRPMSSMTEEEARIVLRFAECDNTTIELLKKTMVTKDGHTWARFSYFFKKYGEKYETETIVMNCLDGQDGLKIYKGNHYYRCYLKVINYLRSIGIDCDGLIDAGLAIDSTKTETR